MIYFKWLSIILGGWMLTWGVLVAVFPSRIKWIVPKFYPEKRPYWVFWTSVIIAGLVAWTWIKFATQPSGFAFVVTFVVSLSLIKVILITCFYGKSRELITLLLEETLALRTVSLSSAAIGLALLALGFFF